MAELSMQQKKEWAKLLYLQGDMLQKEIALKVGTSEKTIGKWIKDENWDNLKKASFLSKEEQIRRAYKMIEALMDEIEQKNEVRGVPDSKQADVLAKLSSTINSLENETNVAQIIDVAKEFTNWLKQQDLAKAQDFISYLDAFIKYKLKAA